MLGIIRRRPDVLVRRRTIAPRVVVRPAQAPRSRAVGALPTPQPAAYLDYARVLTAEGGVLIAYKDIDTRWRWWLWRILAWCAATSFDGWIAFQQSPLHSGWLDALCWLIAAALNLLIVSASVRADRRIEVRPDCLILDGAEVFWRHLMDGGMPELKQKDATTFIFCGVYGTRFVEYGTLRRFDDNDRQPEAFEAHVQLAMDQLWTV